MATAPSQGRLLAIIELQNAIAAAAMSADEVMHIVVDRARGVLGAAAARIALVESEALVYRMAPETGAEGTPVRASELAGRSVAERRAVRSEDARTACVPLLYGEIAVGALELDAAAPAVLSDEDLETMRILGQIVAIALHRAYTYPRPRYDNLQDPLTGLGNRRAFDERLEAELARNRRFGHSFSLALVQLDGLEAATDRRGQVTGDEMLRRLATILRHHTRMIDGCFRIYADQLAIVMPGTSLEGAQVVAERCRAHGAEARVTDGGVRLGVGVVAALDETAEDIAVRASAALAADRAAAR